MEHENEFDEKYKEKKRDQKDVTDRDRDEIDHANDPGRLETWGLAELLCEKGFQKKNIPFYLKNRIRNKYDRTEQF